MDDKKGNLDSPIEEPVLPAHFDQQGGWFLIAPHALPEEWRERAVPVYMIRLDSDDVDGFVLHLDDLEQRLAPEEKEIARLLSQNVPPREIALTLHLSRRSVFRRLARLRQLMGAKSNSELATKLAKQDI